MCLFPNFSSSFSLGGEDHVASARNEAYRNSINSLFPFRLIRFVTDIGLPDKILNSTRYSPHKANLFREVSVSLSHSDIAFRGRWIISNAFESTSDANEADIVIFFLHGGGYFSSSPATYLLFLLRMAEGIIQGGKTVSIFALDYDLAPEIRFPGQLSQARAAYDWLRSEADVPSSKILVLGDSAGGHLALSLLVDLWKSKDENAQQTAPSKPGIGMMLLSPWLSLYHKPDSFTRNEMTDVLTGPFLDRTALRFAGPEMVQSRSPYLEFLNPISNMDWNAILPDWIWVSAGKNEILYDDIVRWIVERGSDCRGTNRINGEIDRAEAHVYAWFSTTDALVRNKFLNTPLKENIRIVEYAAVDRIAEVILEHINQR